MAGVACSVPLTASCRCTTLASAPSPRCCGPSAGARLSHACSERLAAPQVRPLLQCPPSGLPGPAPVPTCLCHCLVAVPPHGLSPAGTCLRLYSEAFEQRLPPSPAPHVSETSLSRLVLLLKRLDIADMGQCDFLDRPGRAHGGQAWRVGLEQIGQPWLRPSLHLGCLWRGTGGLAGAGQSGQSCLMSHPSP